MVTMKYQYPLPNNGSGYFFSEKDLVELLDEVYAKGFEDGVLSSNVAETTCNSANTELIIIKGN